MNVATQSLPITDKEAEALMWGFAQIGDHAFRTGVTDKADPLFILLEAGYQPQAIHEACEEMFPIVFTNCLAGPFTELETMILRLSVENSSWIFHYQLHFPESKGMISEARAALRTLAAKLELIGIDINILPTD